MKIRESLYDHRDDDGKLVFLQAPKKYEVKDPLTYNMLVEFGIYLRIESKLPIHKYTPNIT